MNPFSIFRSTVHIVRCAPLIINKGGGSRLISRALHCNPNKSTVGSSNRSRCWQIWHKYRRLSSNSNRNNNSTSNSIYPSSSTISPNLAKYLELQNSRFNELNAQLITEEDPKLMAKYGKESAALSSLIQLYEEHTKLCKEISNLVTMETEGGGDDELVEMAKAERLELEARMEEVEESLIDKLIPDDEANDRGVVLEVRAGTGGDEASLFAGELFNMYEKFAASKEWKWEELSLTKTDIGGFKEAQANVTGTDVFKYLKFESGVHRVQRVPINDTKIQTSAASVIVMPEAEDVDVHVRPQDIRVDVYRAGGAGGQNVNRTESAVRMTHIATGITVAMQDERSQMQNRAKAMKILLARIYDSERRKAQEARSELRSAAQGTGDRSDKIRTYNFPQDRVSDHRISFTITGIENIMSGYTGGSSSLSDIIEALLVSDKKDRLNNLLETLNNNNNNSENTNNKGGSKKK